LRGTKAEFSAFSFLPGTMSVAYRCMQRGYPHLGGGHSFFSIFFSFWARFCRVDCNGSFPLWWCCVSGHIVACVILLLCENVCACICSIILRNKNGRALMLSGKWESENMCVAVTVGKVGT
jgi:hypothetical protein